MKRPEGKSITLGVEKTFTINIVKTILMHIVRVPRLLQRLIFKGNELEDDTATLQDVGIVDGAIQNKKNKNLSFKL